MNECLRRGLTSAQMAENPGPVSAPKGPNAAPKAGKRAAPPKPDSKGRIVGFDATTGEPIYRAATTRKPEAK